MANIAAQRIKREFKEVIKSEEVSERKVVAEDANSVSAFYVCIYVHNTYIHVYIHVYISFAKHSE